MCVSFGSSFVLQVESLIEFLEGLTVILVKNLSRD